MGNRVYNVLFLCTGNSARSILAEAILNRLGQGRFQAFSAGSHPTGKVNPYALELLEGQGYDVSALRSKDWLEFAEAAAPRMDLVITVCDQAAGEACPVWPRQPATAHWGLPDPAACEGSPAQIRSAFAEICQQLHHRIQRLVSRSPAQIDEFSLERVARELGPPTRPSP